jgi:CPA1 family monovalent cation:H+ antiporter
MQSIEVVLTMLLLVLASGYLIRLLPISLPLPLVQIALGASFAALSEDAVQLDPQVFFLLFLPPLLFLDGWRIPKQDLFRDSRLILQLALGLVVFTVVGAGLLIHWLIPSMPLAVAFALAAIVSPTDPVAVSSLTTRVPMPPRLMHLLEGEALLNDASGLVCFRFAVAAAMTGSFSLASASLAFLWLAVGGIAIGVAVTLGVTRGHALITRLVGEDAGAPILISLLMPFGAYLAAEHLGGSGILAAVAAGITMSYVELTGRTLAVTRVQRAAVWNAVQFALNGIVFVLLGEQLPGILSGAMASAEQSGHTNPWWLAAYALAINFGLAALRLLWVWISIGLDRFVARRRGHGKTERPSWRLVVATSLAGVRGTITLAGVLTLPLLLPDGQPFPARDLAIFLAAAVILLSLVVASIGLPRLLLGLQLPAEPHVEREKDLARREAADAAIAAIERARSELPEAAADPETYTNAAARVMALYQRRTSADAAGIDAETLRRADQAERNLRLVGLRAERDSIFRMARRRRISDQVARRLVREIDLLESRYL